MKTKIQLFALLIFNLHLAYAQITPTPAPTYFVSKGADVQVTTSSIWHSEESIAIDMGNPLSLIISANTDIVIKKHNHNHSSQGIWTSSDGGNTWSGSDQLPNSGEGACDPSCVFDAADQGYVLGLGKQLGDDYDGVNLQTTNNGGVSWNPQVAEDDFNDDKPMSAAIDVSGTSPYVNYFYTAWTNFDTNNDGTDIRSVQINRSTDGGLTFGNLQTLKTGFGHGVNVQTGPNGEVYVCWADYTNETSTTITPGNYIAFASDISNGGTSFTAATDIIKETGAPVVTLSPDNVTSPVAAFNNTRLNDYPSMAVDKGCGPNNHPGRIYIAYSDGFDAGQNLIKVTYSDDNGSTWQSSTTVSTNPSFIQSWFPAIAVDATTGLVNVVYYSIDATSPAFNTNTYVSYSTDGGYTWQTIKASDASHVTSAIIASNYYAGDYISICSYNGNSYATWHDNRSGQWQVYVANIGYSAPISYSRQNNIEINASNLTFIGTSTNEVNFQAENDIISPSNGLPLTVPYGVTYTAGNEIILEPGFEASSGVIGSYFFGGPTPPNTFLAQIKPTDCETPGLLDVANFKSAIIKTDTLNHIGIYCYPNPTANNITFGFSDSIMQGQVTLQIKDINGQMIQSLPISTQANGKFQYDYSCNGLSAGVYFFTFLSSDKTMTSKFIKLN
jgi:hypothetical protein